MEIIDRRLIQALHVERLRRAGVDHEDHIPHVIFQASTIDALLDGAYEGDLTLAELREHGDFGIGTVDQLDGEMIVLDGEFFAARSDGHVYALPLETHTPFAIVTNFEAGSSHPLDRAASFEDLRAQLDLVAPKEAVCIALRVDGDFLRLRLRSVPRQSRPYPPLAQVTTRQVEFELSESTGTLAGFRFPGYVQGLEVAGYHLHYLSRDRTRGGHVLDCALETGVARFDASSDLHIEVPAGLTMAGPDISAEKREILRREEGH